MKQLLEYRAKLIEQLEAAAEEFRTTCLTARDPFKVLDDDGWNTHQLAVHTRDTESLVYGWRIRRMLEEDQPIFQDFDGETWMAEHYNPDEPLASVLDELTASVKATAALLKNLPPKAWSRESSHEVYGGGFTLQTWVERDLAHIREHLQTVEKVSTYKRE